MHQNEVMIDLKVSRRESGLLQNDLALLLNITQERISRLEKGKSILTTGELCSLAIIYDKNVQQLFKLLIGKLQSDLFDRLRNMSGRISDDGTINELRHKTLHSLFERLQARHSNSYEN